MTSIIVLSGDGSGQWLLAGGRLHCCLCGRRRRVVRVVLQSSVVSSCPSSPGSRKNNHGLGVFATGPPNGTKCLGKDPAVECRPTKPFELAIVVEARHGVRLLRLILRHAHGWNHNRQISAGAASRWGYRYPTSAPSTPVPRARAMMMSRRSSFQRGGRTGRSGQFEMRRCRSSAQRAN